MKYGEVAEWFNAAVLKTVEGATPPRVRISASPPIVEQAPVYAGVLLYTHENSGRGVRRRMRGTRACAGEPLRTNEENEAHTQCEAQSFSASPPIVEQAPVYAGVLLYTHENSGRGV